MFRGTGPPSSMSGSCAATRASRARRARHEKRGDIERKPERDGARLRQDVRAGAPSVVPRGYAAAGTTRISTWLAVQLGRHRRRVRRDTTAGWPCTSNAHKAAVVHYKCIEGDVKPRCYAAQMLDRINLLSDGAIGVRRATPLPRRRKTLADRGPDRQPNPWATATRLGD